MKKYQKLIDEFVARTRDILGNNFVKAILYGSYARGDYRENSDIDIMILTTLSDYEIVEIEDEIFDVAYDYMLSDNVTISVNIKNSTHFLYWVDNLPYYKNVKKEGIVLAG